MPKMATIEKDRSGGDTIFRKDSGNRSAHIRDTQRKIEESGFLNSTMDTGRLKSLRGGNACLFCFHTNGVP
jgi:hypothetical protein